MATIAAPLSTRTPRAHVATPGIWTPALSLWQREIVRFYRQKSRVVGVIASPLLFWLVLGSGFAHSFSGSGTSAAGAGADYSSFFFPGAIVMIVLFTAIFSMMSLIQDRNEGFLLSVLAAPVSRSSIVLGKVLGGATLAAIQGVIFLIFCPLVGVHPGLATIALAVAIIVLISFELTALGFAIAWPMDSPQAFHAIVNPHPHPALAVVRFAFPSRPRCRLDASGDALEPTHLRRRYPAPRAVPGQPNHFFARHQYGRHRRFLPADLPRLLGHRESAHEQAGCLEPLRMALKPEESQRKP